MTNLEHKLRVEERKHRDGFPSPRRDVADLLLAAADEINSLRDQLRMSNKLRRDLRKSVDQLNKLLEDDGT